MQNAQHPDLASRHARLVEKLAAGSFGGLVLNPGASLTYLTGLQFHLMERPIVFVLMVSGDAVIVLPELEAGKLQGLDLPHSAHTYGEDPAAWQQVFDQALSGANLDGLRLGIEPRRLRVLELRFLERALPGAAFENAEALVAALRQIKSALEVDAMRYAAVVAEKALQLALNHLRIGMTERDLAGEITAALHRAGADADLPFAPLVAFGENSANPHAFPTDRRLGPDEIVLIDWGAGVDGYFSDITRVFYTGRPEPELLRIAEVVREANRAARALAGPDVLAGSVDLAAREVIAAAGYGDHFIHRTGHGLGLEPHEEPNIFAESETTLEPGMTFTIEPGIYLPGRGGVRIEDDVAITETGVTTLTSLPRTPSQIGMGS